MKEKLTEAINARNNDIKSFVWKLARDKQTGEQEEIRLVDATAEQLNRFYAHCMSMLYSEDKLNPGRYVLLDIIKEQREKCNVELFLRDPAPLKALPEVCVERAVARPHLLRKRQAERAERDGKRILGAGLKVKQRIVDIHQQNAHRHKRILRESFFVL